MSGKRGATTDEGTEAIADRLRQFRKERGLAQEEVAEHLGLTQSVISHYERGELRLHGELIARLARIYQVSTDEILGLEKTKAASGGGNRRFVRRLQRIAKLPERDQEALLRTIDAFLQKIPD